MLAKTKIALAAAVIILGAVSAGRANDTEQTVGGFHVGPLGQHFGGSHYFRSWGRAFAYVGPRYSRRRAWHYE
jgi:hypothetical protein